MAYEQLKSSLEQIKAKQDIEERKRIGVLEKEQQRLIDRQEDYVYLKNHPMISFFQEAATIISQYDPHVHLSITRPEDSKEPVSVKLARNFTQTPDKPGPEDGFTITYTDQWDVVMMTVVGRSSDGNIFGAVVRGNGKIFPVTTRETIDGNLVELYRKEFDKVLANPSREHTKKTYESFPHDPRDQVKKGIREEISFDQEEITYL